jgi:hypothetical protein
MTQTPSPIKAAGRIEQSLRSALTGPKRKELQGLVGWDDSHLSRFLSGERGVTIDKIDALVEAVGFVLVSERFFGAVSILGEVGMHCECARQGRGECGPTRCN